MSCFHPKKAWYGLGKTKNGKSVVVFSVEKALFKNQSFYVNCGQCVGCRKDRARDAGTRIEKEAKLHAWNCLLTLTYDDLHLPAFASLVPDHPRLFIKNLRQELNRGRLARGQEPIFIRYAGAAEYGDTPMEGWPGRKQGRPHYHLVIFGFAFQEDRRDAGKTISGYPQFDSALLDRLWGKGRARISDVNAAVGDYVGQYIFKKMNGHLAEAHYRVVDPDTGEFSQLVPEFQFQSSRPGIGRGFAEKYAGDLHQGFCISYDQASGISRKRPVPKYFLRVLEDSHSDMVENIKASREAHAEKHREDSTWDRLETREAVALARLKAKGRKAA